MRKILAIISIVIIVLGLSLYLWLRSITKKVFVAQKVNQPVIETPLEKLLKDKAPLNILLLGYGGQSHDGTYLTDSIMVAHIDPFTKKIFLISIPRDIWVKLTFDNQNEIYKKINAAYAIGLDKGEAEAGRMAKYAVSQITGLTIENFISIDFTGFSKTIDTLGGVNINVEKTFDDYEYPLQGQENDLCGKDEDFKKIEPFLNNPDASPADKEQLFKDKPELEEFLKNATSEASLAFPCRYEKLHFDAGLQFMDGVKALKYVRSRHSLQDGTDFGRAKRQRNLLLAVKEKVLTIGFIPQIIPFISSIGDNLRTDLSISDVQKILQKTDVLSTYQVSTLALTDENFLINTYSDDGQSILAPKDGIGNWSSVHNWLNNEFQGISPTPSPSQPIKNNIKSDSNLAK